MTYVECKNLDVCGRLCFIYKSHENCDSIITTLQEGLNTYIEWGTNNNMHLNVSKTKAMLLFPTIDYNLYRPLITGGREIPYVHVFNYLGVV